MPPVDPADEFSGTILTSQIIIGALMMGLVFFLGVIFLMVPAPAARPGQEPQMFLTGIAFLFAVPAALASVLVPSFLVRTTRRQIGKGTWKPARGTSEVAPEPLPPGPAGERLALLMLYQNQMIVGAALNEGAAFFALVATMIERKDAALALALVLIAGVAARFPTRERVLAWIDRQHELMIQERQFSG